MKDNCQNRRSHHNRFFACLNCAGICLRWYAVMLEKKAGLMAFVLIAATQVYGITPSQSPNQDSQARPESCEVRGVVVAADTGLPLKSATVTLTAMSKEDVKFDVEPSPLEEETATETTDTTGHFVFEHIPAGDYVLRSSKAGFISTTYHRRDGDAGDRIELKSGDKVDNLQLALTRGGVIIGRITDEVGEPVAGVLVSAQGPTVRAGDGHSRHDRFATTNDLGEYRIYSVQPGRYYVTATDTGFTDAGTAWVVTSGRKKPRHVFPRIYYPGVFRITEAQKILVGGGREIHIDFSLKMGKLLSVAGRVLTPDGKPAANARVELRDNATLGRAYPDRDVMIDCDTEGKFEFRGVLLGSYTVNALDEDRTQKSSAEQQIELAGNNLSGLQLQLMQPVTISGKVTTEPGRKFELETLEIILDKDVDYAGNLVNPKPDGTFVIGDLTHPPLLLQVLGLPQGWCVLSADLGKQNVLENGLWFSDPSVKDKDTLRIVVGPGAAKIEGIVRQGDDPVAHAEVKLFQEFSNGQNTPIHQRRENTQTDKEGHFIFVNLSPGRYSVLAFASDTEEDGFPPQGDPSFVVSRSESKTLTFNLPETQE